MMPITVVIGGQYGSEGKGKVALHWARMREVEAVVRVGGPNSGHTGVDLYGKSWIFRQLPASSLYSKAIIILPAGSLIDPELLTKEINDLKINPDRVMIDPNASVVTELHKLREVNGRLISEIASTGSGTGAALSERISRSTDHILASDHPLLKPYTNNSTTDVLRSILRDGGRVLIEGTQGFGLSIWHGGHYPYATSRDTTAAGFVAESGLAPHDVDEVIMVIRTFPIRVGGNSGPLEKEITWEQLAKEANLEDGYVELTSATRKIRRVARFDPNIVRKAITYNAPHKIVLNHVDYFDGRSRSGLISRSVDEIIDKIEMEIGMSISFIGVSPSKILSRTTTV